MMLTKTTENVKLKNNDTAYNILFASGMLTLALHYQKVQEIQDVIDDTNVQEAAIDRRIKSIQYQQQDLKQEKRDLEHHMRLVKILPPSKVDRHWIIPKDNKYIGWLPQTNEYIPIFSTKSPTIQNLNKLLEKCPYTETVNFAMTV